MLLVLLILSILNGSSLVQALPFPSDFSPQGGTETRLYNQYTGQIYIWSADTPLCLTSSPGQLYDGVGRVTA
jgi:hypothetical protein